MFGGNRPEFLASHHEISRDDIASVRAFRAVLEPHVDRLSTAFCQRVVSFEGALHNPAIAAIQPNLHAAQCRYLLSLGDPIDEKYIESRYAIGLMLRQVDLSPRWYLGGYALYASLLDQLVFQHFGNNCSQCKQVVQAFNRLFLLDIHLAIEAYEKKNLEEVTDLHREFSSERKGLHRYLKEHEVLLHATKQRARAAEELATLSGFASGLAHEIGSPMNAILTHVELLESSVQDEASMEWLSIIQEQIERITKIVHSFLDLSRRGEPEFAPVCLQQVLESTLAFVKANFEKRGIKVSTDFLPTPQQIIGDANRLQQVMLNLLINAADAMGDSGELHISVVEAGGSVCVKIQDDGHGIDEESVLRIFDPFFTTKAAGDGTGLGLVVAKSIVEEHGGEIFVRSKAGEGSSFHVCLPCASQEEGSMKCGCQVPTD